MADKFEGYVLRGPRVSPANAQSTAEPTTGVTRCPKPVPSEYDSQADAPAFVDAYADQYRASVLDAPGTTAAEYLVWAQNTGSLAMVDNPDWWVEEGSGSIPNGTLEVENADPDDDEPNPYEDGTDRAVVTDNGGRSIGIITTIVIARGDVRYFDLGWRDSEDPTQGRNGFRPYITVVLTEQDQDTQAGIVRLTRDTLEALPPWDGQQILDELGGGLSAERGDQIISVTYTLSPVRFYWTRNDRYETRFAWNGQQQRWAPIKGSAPKDLGILLFDESYQMSPKITNLPVNAFLPGDGNDPDAYAMIRLGPNPGASSTPVGTGDPDGYTGIQVKSDSQVEDGFDFSTDPGLAGVMGQTTGKLEFNPSYVQLHAGKTVWFVYKSFSEEEDGIVGKLNGADIRPLFIAPVPGPTDTPLLRLGSRKYLSITMTDTEAELAALPNPSTGQAIVALSTGRVKLSPEDIAKADPTNITSFDKYFLGEDLVYDGTALNQVPQPTKAPVALIDEDGDDAIAGTSDAFYLPEAVTLPDDYSGTDLYRGLGRSGVIDAPDGTGALPAQPGVPGSVRPGGDDESDVTTGRLRQISDGVGDIIVFGRTRSTDTVYDEPRNSDLPFPSYKVRRGRAYIAQEDTPLTLPGPVTIYPSRVSLSRSDLRSWSGDKVYFLQSSFTPAVHTLTARLFSKTRDVFRFDGEEILYFAIDGQLYKWESSNLTGSDFYTATEVAESITNDSEQLPGPGTGLITGTAYEMNGRVVLGATNEATGNVEIGWGEGGEKDLSGAAVLGFMPGWKARGGLTNWLPDSGTSLGLFRSPLNLDRTRAIPDFKDTNRLDEEILQEAVSANPFQFLDNPPLQDVAGFDENIFFSLSTTVDDGFSVTIVQRYLDHYDDIIYRFGQSKFDWVVSNAISESLQAPAASINLEQSVVVPESMLGAPEIGGGLYVSEGGGSAEFQTQDTDYLLPENGIPGIAVLVEKLGSVVSSGARGVITEGSDTFSDDSTDTDFTQAEPGYRLKVLSGGEPVAGSYVVQEVVDAQNIRISPTPTGTPERLVTWELYEGVTEDVYDPSIVADMSYKTFNHLQSEPFEVFLLSPVGTVPESSTAQENSRLFAYMEKALASNRPIGIRFGLVAATAANTASMIALTQTELGTLANNALDVPETDSQRFTTGSFSIKIGTTVFENDGVLLKGVTTFSSNPGGGDGIEYLTQEATIDGVVNPIGRLKFGSNLLVNYESSVVHYAQAFQPPADLAALTVEYDPTNGRLNFSATEISTFGGSTTAYFVERMITEEREDVAINPLLGSFAFNQPVSENSTVEVSYWAADLEGRKVGDQITEFLPVYIQDEEAVRDEDAVSPSVFYFNVDPRRTIDQRIEPLVYIGAVMQNYNALDYILDYPDYLNGQGRLSFTREIPDHVTVQVSYAVLEAIGGERAYDASTKPLYRPPFFIEAGQSRFGLRGDRADEFQPGQILRVDNETFYIESTKYYPQNDEGTGDVTAVNIFPSTVTEVGSRSPGNDSISAVSNLPITSVIDPDGSSPIPTSAAAGLMSAIDLTDFPFEPINRGQMEVIFLGNLLAFAQPGHIIEVGGEPHTIGQAELTDDGTRTKITVTNQFKTGYSVEEATTIKLTYRPIYAPQSFEFNGVGPLVIDEPYELILYGETDTAGNELPGRTLIEGVEYTLDPDTGAITLLEPLQEPLEPTQKLVFTFTRLRVLQPFWDGGTVSFPRYAASYLYNIAPSDDNGFLNAQLTGTFTFRNPDSFYYRAVSMPEFLVEAAQDAIEDIRSQEPAGGAILTSGPGQENWEQGRIGLKSERSALEDQDRAARAFLDFYNSSIVSFEQINETISGGFIGDRDGKFRFWVGRGKDYPTPGYEDDISGDLTRRNIWSEVFNQADPGAELFYLTTDWIVRPGSQDLDGGVVEGSFPNPDRVGRLLEQQRPLIKNDVDDMVMTSLARPKLFFKLRYPFFYYKVKGRFRTLYQRSRFSRIFPTETRAFFMSYPGVGGNQETEDPDAWSAGRYTYGAIFFGDKKRTTGKTIGQLWNPALGDIDRRVSNVKLSRRRARARIWGYFPNGIPDFSFQGGTEPGGADPSITEPCLIAVPALLRDIPIDPGTGFPDDSQLISQGFGLSNSEAWLPDAVAGDPELVVPGFERGDEVSLGKPDGTTYDAFWNRKILANPFDPTWTFLGLQVYDISYGCVIRFQSPQGLGVVPPKAPITNPNDILVGTGTDVGIPFADFPVETHDTIFAGPPLKSLDAPIAGGTSNAATQDDIIELAQGLDDYRTGYDVRVTGSGRVVDKTWPSFYDPSLFGIKEIFGQHPPDPLSYLEADVRFYYDGLNPFQFPALRGEVVDDSGDYQIPYIKAANTELDRFDEAMIGISPVMTEVDDLGGYIYPDEILGTDGAVLGPAQPPGFATPASLLTDEDAEPRLHGITEPGIGDIKRYDLLLIQAAEASASKFEVSGGPATTVGPMGIQSIGEIDTLTPPPAGSKFEPPRFITQTTPPPPGGVPVTPSPVSYIFTNAMSYADGAPADSGPPASPGVQIIEDQANNITRLDFSSLGQFALNDGFTPVPVYGPSPGGTPTGNLNRIWSLIGPKSNNIITIKLISRLDPAILNGPLGGNPLPSVSGGVVALTIQIQGGSITLTDYQGNIYGPFALIPGFDVAFGTKWPVPVNGPPAEAVLDNKEIIIPQIGMIPWGPGPGTTAEWFLPHTVTAGPTYTMNYGFEFTFDIDTFNAATGESDTAWVDNDRLTFHEVFDLRMAQERGTVYPYSGGPPPPPYTQLQLEAGLVVTLVTMNHPSVGAIQSWVNATANGFTGVIPNPFTFKTRTVGSTPGDWQRKTDLLLDYEQGTIKAMAFEGWNNTEITTSDDVTFSAIPSDERFSGGRICRGAGGMASQYNPDIIAGPYDPLLVDNRVIISVAPTNGLLENIESGDILVVESNPGGNHLASTKAGTYVVRHVVESDNFGLHSDYRISQDSGGDAPVTLAGSESGWCPIHFPTVVDFDTATRNLTLSDPAPARGGTPVGGTTTGFLPAIAGERVYIIRSVNDLNSSDLETRRRAVIMANYTGLSLDGERLVIEGLTAVRYSDGTVTGMTPDEFKALITDKPYQVSGMMFLPVNVSGESYGLPDNNTVGWHDPSGVGSVAGFKYVTFQPALNAGTGIFWDASAGPSEIELNVAPYPVAPTPPHLGIETDNPPTPWIFENDELAPVYDYVVHTIRLDSIPTVGAAAPSPSWRNLNGFNGTQLKCILPGTSLEIRDSVPLSIGPPFAPGHYAQAGIFLEPSVPRPTLDLANSDAKVVDTSHSLPDPQPLVDEDRQVGMRDAWSYNITPGFLNQPEQVNYEVRRIRRWHEIQEEADSNLKPLRYAYEIRRGRIKNYLVTAKQGGILTANDFVMNWDDSHTPHQADPWNDGYTYTGTNLGPFNDEDVNVNAGDQLRLLDEFGDLVDEAQIESILSDREILLAAPGLTKYTVAEMTESGNPDGGMRFEIYLRRPPVPHEQSNEQLLELITDRVVHRTFPTWGDVAGELGGHVPDMEGAPTPDWGDVANRLMDDLHAPTPDQPFSALGIQPGDIVIVDPVGKIPRKSGLPSTQEQGARPIGDDGVASRPGPPPPNNIYTAGTPDDLDDNRGFYRVTSLADASNPPYLEVDPVTTFTGDVDNDVIFGTPPTDAYEYAVYPTIHDSQLRDYFGQDADEGQMDLRPTYERAANGTFSNYPTNHLQYYSIRPFGYRVIRASGLFTDETIDLVLSTRERMLSWIEMIRAVISGYKSGSYFIFQRDEHISDLGNTTNPQAGLGLLSNDYITSILGRLDVVPYINNESCLSLLDRRFWIQDWRLDFLKPDPADPTLKMVRISPGDTAYTAYTDFSTGGVVRPVLPERVDEVLDTRDRFRPIRFVWLAYRTHVKLGTLASIVRFDEELPERLEEQKRLLLLEDSIEGIGE